MAEGKLINAHFCTVEHTWNNLKSPADMLLLCCKQAFLFLFLQKDTEKNTEKDTEDTSRLRISMTMAQCCCTDYMFEQLLLRPGDLSSCCHRLVSLGYVHVGHNLTQAGLGCEKDKESIQTRLGTRLGTQGFLTQSGRPEWTLASALLLAWVATNAK